MNELQENDTFAVTKDSLAYPECIYCLCRSCMYLRKTCRTCYICLFGAVKKRYCLWYVPFIFRRSPYQEWFRELELLRIRRAGLRNIDLLDFKG